MDDMSDPDMGQPKNRCNRRPFRVPRASSFGLRPASQVITDKHFAWKFLDINKTYYRLQTFYRLQYHKHKHGDVLVSCVYYDILSPSAESSAASFKL